MGSLLFDGASGRPYGGELAQAEFRDDDGVPVYATLILGMRGALFELDMWKADSSRLMRIPPVTEMRIVK